MSIPIRNGMPQTDFQFFAGQAARNLGATLMITASSSKINDWGENKNPPTDEEMNAEVVRLRAEYDTKQYQRDRKYPGIREQLDMLFHDMTAGKGTKDGEWYKVIAKVKTDNPKPE